MNFNLKKILLITMAFVTNTLQAGQPIASINGSACSFNTIADAIAAANSNDTINIKGGTHSQIIGEISIDLTLVASRGITGCEIGNNAIATIDGMGQTFDSTGGLVKITNGAKVTFRDMALINASAINGGIMAIVGSSATLDNTDIYGGSALTAGGNLYVSSDSGVESTLTINNGSSIYNGTVVTGDGGGLAIYDSSLIIIDGSFGLTGLNQGNLASNNGGGIYAENSNLVITNLSSLIQNNTANNSGGGIFTIDSTIDISDASINDNTSANNGGGMYVNNTNVTLKDATVSNNLTTEFTSNVGGGGMYVIGSSQIVLDSTTLLSNTSEVLGGGILNVSATSSISIMGGSDIINNDARFGGGIYTLSPISIDGSRILFNTATHTGGGIWCNNCQSLSIVNSSQVSNNTAKDSGGGISIFDNTDTTFVELKNSSFVGNNLTNSVSSFGGAIAQDGGTILIDTCIISNNTGAANGGGVYLFDLDLVNDSARIINSEFRNNSNSLTNSDFGGGALNLNEIFSGHISGTEFTDNNTGKNGGAINMFASNLTIDESIISGNHAISEGGGIFTEDSELIIRNSSIIQNDTVDLIIITPGSLGGGGIKALNSNLEIINSKINQNISHDIGGGIFYVGGSSNSLSIQSEYGILSDQCMPSDLGFNEYCSEVSNNTAIFAAGLMIRGSTSEQGITLSGVAFNGNITSGFPSVSGVAIDIDLSNPIETDVTMENLIIVENDGLADTNKSAVLTKGNIRVNLLSATLANNTVRSFRAGTDTTAVVVQNSILQQNDSGPLIPGNVPFISLCNNSEIAELGGQDFGSDLGDPQFITTSRGDYRLAATSPSLDACSFGALLDIDGNIRPNDNANYDQGAFEMNAEFSVREIFMNGFE